MFVYQEGDSLHAIRRLLAWSDETTSPFTDNFTGRMGFIDLNIRLYYDLTYSQGKIISEQAYDYEGQPIALGASPDFGYQDYGWLGAEKPCPSPGDDDYDGGDCAESGGWIDEVIAPGRPKPNIPDTGRPDLGDTTPSYPSYLRPGGGGGGGGFDGGWIDEVVIPWKPKKYTAEKGDKLAKENLAQTVEEQLPNTCVTTAMEYMNHELCGEARNHGVYIMDYRNKYKLYVLRDGVESQYMVDFKHAVCCGSRKQNNRRSYR